VIKVSSSSVTTVEFAGRDVPVLSFCASAFSEREHFYTNRDRD